MYYFCDAIASICLAQSNHIHLKFFMVFSLLVVAGWLKAKSCLLKYSAYQHIMVRSTQCILANTHGIHIGKEQFGETMRLITCTQIHLHGINGDSTVCLFLRCCFVDFWSNHVHDQMFTPQIAPMVLRVKIKDISRFSNIQIFSQKFNDSSTQLVGSVSSMPCAMYIILTKLELIIVS